MSKERIYILYPLDICFAPKLIGDYQFKNMEFKGICLKQDSFSFLHKNIVNLYISYKSDTSVRRFKYRFYLS